MFKGVAANVIPSTLPKAHAARSHTIAQESDLSKTAMITTCPNCSAPFLVPDTSEGVPKCPNCDHAELPRRPTVRAPSESREEDAGRSSIVSVVALLHFFFAATQICVGVGFASAVGRSLDRTIRLSDEVIFAVSFGSAAVWVGVGFGLLARRWAAVVLSLGLSGWAIVNAILLVAAGNLCGAGFALAICVFMPFVLVSRRAEFR